MQNRFYLQALAVTGLFIALLLLIWVASGGPASEAAVTYSNSTRTAIAQTEVYLLRPVPTDTPESLLIPTFETQPEATQTGVTPIGVTPTAIAPTGITPTEVVPIVGTPTEIRGSVSGRSPILSSTNNLIPNQTLIAPTAGIPITGVQDPAGFARWYFERVWKERDYQNLWDNYLTPSFNAHVGSGLFADYVSWWDSVERVDVNSVDVLENNGTNALVRVNLTLHMKDGHVLPNQIFTYELLYNANRNHWMFDYTS